MNRSTSHSRPQHGWFHVTNLGVDHFDIFDTRLNHRVFEHEIRVATDLFGVQVHAYCWMTNHFHLIVHCPGGNLSRFMQRVEQQYVLKHNRAIGRRGPLFIGRFSAFPIGLDDPDADDGLRVVARYVHRNPLDIVPIECLATWRDSSYGVYLGTRSAPDWLMTDVLSSVHGSSTAQLKAFTEMPLLSDRTPAAGRRFTPFTATEILEAVAAASGETAGSLLVPRPRRRVDARVLAAMLVVDLRATSELELPELFGVSKVRGVRRMAAKGRALLATDRAFATLRDRAMSILEAMSAGLAQAA